MHIYRFFPFLRGRRSFHVKDLTLKQSGSSCILHPAFCILLTAPAPGTHARLDPHVPHEMQQLEVSAVVNDAINTARLDILVDGVRQASLDAAPYHTWWTLETGEHHLVAVAIDRDGKRWESEPIVVTVEK